MLRIYAKDQGVWDPDAPVHCPAAQRHLTIASPRSSSWLRFTNKKRKTDK